MDTLAKIKQCHQTREIKRLLALLAFLQGKQSVEVAIELDMPADKVEELHIRTGDFQGWITWKYCIMRLNIHYHCFCEFIIY